MAFMGFWHPIKPCFKWLWRKAEVVQWLLWNWQFTALRLSFHPHHWLVFPPVTSDPLTTDLRASTKLFLVATPPHTHPHSCQSFLNYQYQMSFESHLSFLQFLLWAQVSCHWIYYLFSEFLKTNSYGLLKAKIGPLSRVRTKDYESRDTRQVRQGARYIDSAKRLW